MTAFEARQATLGAEFTLYVLEHPEFAKRIPKNALIVFQVEGQDKFNRWARQLAKKIRDKGQTFAYVRTTGLIRRSRLVRPRIEAIAA